MQYASDYIVKALGTQPLTLSKSMWLLQEPGCKGFLWAPIPAGPKPDPTPSTSRISSARQYPCLCLSTSSASLLATPLPVTFLALWRAVLCAVTHCTPLVYPVPSAVWILPPKWCYKNYAMDYVQRPPPFPSPPYQASYIFSNHQSSQMHWIKDSYLPSESNFVCSQEVAEGRIHSIYCCNYNSQGHILSKPCWSSLTTQKDVAQQANFLAYYRNIRRAFPGFHLKGPWFLIAWTVLTPHLITFFF